MRQSKGIVCDIEHSSYKGFLCPIKITPAMMKSGANERYCRKCLEEKPVLEEFSSRKRE